MFTHIIASNKAPLSSLPLITPFHFSFFLLLVLHLCATVPSPLPQLLFPRFHFPSPKTPFSLSFLSFFCFLSFPQADKGWPPTCLSFYIHKTYTCMKMIKSQDVYCTWADTRLEPGHTVRCCIFSIEAMDCLEAWNENPLNRTFFTFTRILSRLGEDPEFKKK